MSWAVATDSTFAMGPSVVDPRSGEVIDANIVFTSGWVGAWLSMEDKIDPHPPVSRTRNHHHRKGAASESKSEAYSQQRQLRG